MAELVSGRGIVADLVAADVDPLAIRLVRHGLGAIAGEIRSWGEVDNEHAGDLDEAAALVDPEAAG